MLSTAIVLSFLATLYIMIGGICLIPISPSRRSSSSRSYNRHQESNSAAVTSPTQVIVVDEVSKQII